MSAQRGRVMQYPGKSNLRASCRENQCSFVYPYPSVSDLAGGNSDHGPRKTRTKTQTTPDSVFTRARRNSDHGLSLGCFWGRGRQGGVLGEVYVLEGGSSGRSFRRRLGRSFR